MVTKLSKHKNVLQPKMLSKLGAPEFSICMYYRIKDKVESKV